MSTLENEVRNDGEISLLELIRVIWLRKTFIFFTTVSATALTALSLLFIKVPFVSTTEIRTISAQDANQYIEFNSLEFFKLDAELLRALFVETLDDRDVLVEGLKKFNVIDAKKFGSKNLYESAVREAAEDIQLLPPFNVDGTQGRIKRIHWLLVAEGVDEERWREVLRHVNSEAQKAVAETLRQRFDAEVKALSFSNKNLREDLLIALDNSFEDFEEEMREYELRLGFDMQDVDEEIFNARQDYDRETKDRIEFLVEQAAIARKLGIAKNTLEAQTFNAASGVVANLETDRPFYLRGYDAIEMEIELIRNRENPLAFVEGLYELEKRKRELEQDQTLIRASKEKEFLDDVVQLRTEIRSLEQNKTIERATLAFEATPILSDDPFVAVNMLIEASDFKNKISKGLLVILVAVIAALGSVLYVLVSPRLSKGYDD